MKSSILEKNITPQYIIDEKGKKSAVILNIKIYERLLEELEELYLGNIAKIIKEEKEETKSLKEFEKELKANRK